ncbi:MAG TPA: hypothetical protein VF503_21440 [Sphingobium sp.]|uniref:hypothetical protein n=1 Tax=Sphingobium sp. TaxID=1912891 RepID=UPI002ED435D5
MSQIRPMCPGRTYGQWHGRGAGRLVRIVTARRLSTVGGWTAKLLRLQTNPASVAGPLRPLAVVPARSGRPQSAKGGFAGMK